MAMLTVTQLLNFAGGLVNAIGVLSVQLDTLKALAKQTGASDEQLAALDVKLTEAIARRRAELGL